MDQTVRRRRLRHRSWNFGTRELDLLLGSFADLHLDQFAEAQLDEYERLLSVPVPDLFGWITGAAEVPLSEKSEVTARLIAFGREAHVHVKN